MRDELKKVMDDINKHLEIRTRDQIEAAMDKLRVRRNYLEGALRDENFTPGGPRDWKVSILRAKIDRVQAQINALYWVTERSFTEDAWLEVK